MLSERKHRVNLHPIKCNFGEGAQDYRVIGTNVQLQSAPTYINDHLSGELTPYSIYTCIVETSTSGCIEAPNGQQ